MQLRLCHIPSAHRKDFLSQNEWISQVRQGDSPWYRNPRISRNRSRWRQQVDGLEGTPAVHIARYMCQFAPGIDMDRVGSTAAAIEPVCVGREQVSGDAAAFLRPYRLLVDPHSVPDIVRGHPIGE